jgi:hypothetical protein
MTSQERIAAPVPPMPLLEALERQLAVLSDGHTANRDAIAATKAELQQQIKQVDERLIKVDVKLTHKIVALDTKVDALDTRVSALDTRVSALDIVRELDLLRFTYSSHLPHVRPTHVVSGACDIYSNALDAHARLLLQGFTRAKSASQIKAAGVTK